MSTYAIGDIQGCYDPLMRLLDKLSFNPEHDTLWVAGDLVNRGPQSAEVLRYLKGLGERCIAVMGNHDLHLLAVAAGIREAKGKDTLDSVLDAPDVEELLQYLRHLPFIHHDAQRQLTMVHAGLPPMWDIPRCLEAARDLESVLQGPDYVYWLKKIFKKKKQRPWSDDLNDKKKRRLASNYFTQMRFCDINGVLDLKTKGSEPLSGFFSWYSVPNRVTASEHIIFGHWAALEGDSGLSTVHALDTGCVWGRELTAMNVDNFERTSVSG